MKSRLLYFTISLLCCVLCGCCVRLRCGINNKTGAEIFVVSSDSHQSRLVDSYKTCFLSHHCGDVAILSHGCVYSYNIDLFDSDYERFLVPNLNPFYHCVTLRLTFDKSAKLLVNGPTTNGMALEPKKVMPIFPGAPWDLKQKRRKK